METTIIPILTLLLGWILANVAEGVRSQRAARAGFRKAIADLLEVRHRLRGYQDTVREIKKAIPIPLPASAEIHIRKLILQMVGMDASFLERFMKSVETVAEVDPILAYRLRGKEQAQRLLVIINQGGSLDPIAAEFAIEAERDLLQFLVPAVEEIILESCKVMDRRLARRVKKLFSTRNDVEPAAAKLLEKLRTKILEEMEKSKTTTPGKAPEPTLGSVTPRAIE